MKQNETANETTMKVIKSKRSRREKTFRMIMLALFIAIMLVMDFTPLGYIYAGVFVITLMTIPVVAGAISLGPLCGMLLGAVFGLTSFLQAFGIGYVIDPSAQLLFSTSPFGTIFTCFVPRMLMGFCVGWIFRLISNTKRIKPLAYPIAAASGAVLNTAFFMTSYIIMFKNTILAETTVAAVLMSVLTLNLVVEICVSLVLGSAVGKGIDMAIKKISRT
jgi:uncharacterized membrane protein